MDIFKTVVQLASQEPAGSRLLQEAEAALQKAHTLQQEVIEWANKPAAPLPCVMEIREHSECVSAVAVSPDGKWIASGSCDKTVKVVMVETGRVVHTLKGHSPDNEECTCKHDAGRDKQEYEADLNCPVQGHSGEVLCVVWAPDGSKLVSGGGRGEIKLWSPSTGECLDTLEGHSDAVFGVAWSIDGLIASASRDRTLERMIIIWNPSAGECLKVLKGHSCKVNCVSFNPSNPTLLVSGSDDCTVRLWDVGTGKELMKLKGHRSTVSACVFAPRGKTIVSASWDKTLKIWDVELGTCLTTLKGHSREVVAVSWSINGLLASGSFDKMVKIWNPSTGECLKTLEGHSNLVRSVAWRFDGRLLVSCGDDYKIILWDPKKGEGLKTLEGHSDWVNTVAWRFDGRLLASGGDDKRIILWDPENGERLKTLEGHRNSVKKVEFSQDGATLVSSNDYETLSWDVAKGARKDMLAVSAYAGQLAWVCDGRPSDYAVEAQSVGMLVNSLTVPPLLRHMPGARAASEHVAHVEGGVAFTKATNGRYIVQQKDDLIFVYDTRGGVVNADGEEKVPIAFFRAPSPVVSVCCAGGKVAVGCQNGAVLTLHAAWLTDGGAV